MEIFLLFIILFLLLDLESKVTKINKRKELPKRITSNEIKKLINKVVSLNIENDHIDDSYLFSPVSSTKGKIIEYDDEWILFEYENKKEVIRRCFRIKDISSIDES